MKRFSFGRIALPVYTFLALAFLMTPIVYIFVFSFNKFGRRNTGWREFTFDNWINICKNKELCGALGNSISISLISTVFATILGTALAIALVRYSFRFRSLVNLSLFLPMATPEIVMGAGLANLFFTAGVSPGFVPTVLAHVMFCLSFVVVTVKARVQTLDPALEEAGRDLYAKPSAVFWKITFPLLLPGIMAAALLSFALSFDDYIITYLNRGPVETFPTKIFALSKQGMPPQAYVIASTVFILAILIVLGSQIYGNIKRKRLAAK